MDFDYEQVKKDLVEAKDFIVSGKKFKKLTFLGRGQQYENGEVRKFKSIAIKHAPDEIRLPFDTNEQRISLSEKGIELGLHFAPYLDFESEYAFMPFIGGVDYHGRKGIGQTLKLGNEGIEKFFDDSIKLCRLGLLRDDMGHNFLVSKSGITSIDLSVDPRIKLIPTKYLLSNAVAILLYNHFILEYKKKELIELREKIKDVLGKFRDRSDAINYSKKFTFASEKGI